MSNPCFDDFVDDVALNMIKTFKFFNERFNRAADNIAPVSSVPEHEPVSLVFSPKMDLFENAADNRHLYNIVLDLPGFRQGDVSIEVSSNNTVTIAGDRSDGSVSSRNYLKRERFNRKFTRQVRLPPDANIDTVVASFADGVLSVIIEKTSSSNQNRKINISW